MIFYRNKIYIDLVNFNDFKLLYSQIKLHELLKKINKK